LDERKRQSTVHQPFIRAADTLCFMKRIALLILLAALPVYGADDCHIACIAKREAVRYVRDAKSLATAPLRWDRKEWTRFGEGSAAVLALYATDRQSSDYVQRHRSSSTDQFAKDITPFGGHRALQLSVLMIAAGAGIHDTTLRDAGRDSFESELLAEVLAAFDLEFDVEIKSNRAGRMGELVAATARVIRDAGRVEQTLVSSFDPFALIQFHRHLPEVAGAYLFHDEQPLPLRRGTVGRWIGASLVHPQHTLVTEASVKRWHGAGLPINVWTVDDADELRRLAALGVDGVFSNDVAHALAVLTM